MKRWWKWLGASAGLGVAAGAMTTLMVDRSWGSELLPRCLTFSIGYAVIGPVGAWVRRNAERRHRRQTRDLGEAQPGRDES